MKIKVLILIDWFLPGNKAGGPVKSIYSMVKLLQDNIDFYIITMNTDILSDKVYQLNANEWTKYEDINVYYFSKENFSAKNLKSVISQLSPDVIYINSFWSYKFSILPLILKKFNKIHQPIVLSPRGMLEQGAMNIKSLKKKIFLFISKIMGIHCSIVFHATSQNEKESIQRYFPSANIFLIPNLSYINKSFVSINKNANELKLFYLSRVSPVKNLDLAIKVLSKINVSPNTKIEYDIFGNNEDKDYFRNCKDLMKTLPEQIKVTYKGTLSFDEIPKTISQYHFLFLPTGNENFGHAIVETLSCGRPVLISNCTPWNEVNNYNCGYALPIDEQLFIEKLNTIIQMDNNTFQEMCSNAQRFINKKMDIEKIKAEYLKLFEYAATSKNN